MIIGIPKETKIHEHRVGLTPFGVKELQKNGHRIIIENNAGKEIGFDNEQYVKAGAKIVNNASEVYNKSQLIIKVKEPDSKECLFLQENQIIFSYLHLANNLQLTNFLLNKKITAIAFETVRQSNNLLPILAPMSDIAGKLSIQIASRYLEKNNGGKGILISGALGVKPAKILILGGGTCGIAAAKIAHGMGANVTILEKSLDRIIELHNIFDSKINIEQSNELTIKENIIEADIVIGAVLIPGMSTPKIVNKETIKKMKKKSVIVDVAIDQGGCFETSKATNHNNPIYEVNDVIHYCVTNIPAIASLTATIALENVSLFYIKEIANHGKKISEYSHDLKSGINTHMGNLINKNVALSFGMKYSFLE